MRSLWRSRRRLRVDEFARGVDDTVTPDPDEGGTSRLVAIAHALRSMPLRQAPEFTLAVRRRIVNAARAAEVDQPRPLLASLLEGFRVQRGLAATTALLTAAVAMMSIGFGTTKALPGDTLYGLKLSGERIGIALARTDEARGHSYLHFAESRLHDVSGLIDHDGTWRNGTQPVATDGKKRPEHRLASLVNSTLTTMNGYTTQGATALRRAYQRTGDTAPLAYLDEFTRTQRESLRSMLAKLPAASQSVAGQSLTLMDKLDKEANKLLTEQCGHVLNCQSEPRADQTSPSAPTSSAPTQAPTTSLTNGIQTNETDQPDTTTPQRTPSTTRQPGTTGTPPSTGTSSGDQPSSTPPGTGGTGGDSSSGDGSDSTKNAPSSTDPSGSDSTQPSPPAPTGVPSNPANSPDGSRSSAPAPDDSGNSGDSGTSTDSTDSPAATPSDTSSDQSSPEATPAG